MRITDRPQPQVRRAVQADVLGLVTSCHDLIVEDAGGHDPWSNQNWASEIGVETFAARVGAPHRLILLLDDGTVAGHLDGLVEKPAGLRTVRTATIGSLFAAIPYRGHGWGGKLVEQFLLWAEKVGARRVTMTAYSENEAAIRFYRSHGFAPLETVLRRGAST